MYYASGQAMRLPGRRLDLVAKFFHCENQRTPLTPETWADAAAGDKRAMREVVEHCEADVLVLRDVWEHLAPFVSKITFQLKDVWESITHIPSRKKAA